MTSEAKSHMRGSRATDQVASQHTIRPTDQNREFGSAEFYAWSWRSNKPNGIQTNSLTVMELCVESNARLSPLCKLYNYLVYALDICV